MRHAKFSRSYKSKAALKAHGSSEKVLAFQRLVKDEVLTLSPAQLIFTQPIAGFISRL
jgi:quinol monooxygenase YgiN